MSHKQHVHIGLILIVKSCDKEKKTSSLFLGVVREHGASLSHWKPGSSQSVAKIRHLIILIF